ncbi:MAG TPA: tRNA lysidine(34) synthetase TilS [Candidatus Dormibacteraeota bacterium]|nr:tRNA lysidine(34) synthetase TilS [Candidatus Dormibacteraeota bacterium]
MLVALSGGPDSTALLLGLIAIGVPVVAAHFDHRLRPESGAEALKVAELCAAHDVRLIAGHRSQPLASGSRQAAARIARYAFLDAARQECSLDVVALAHTADDLVETVLLNLGRGAGLAGMRGMPSRRGPYVRPLLNTWRSEIEEFLKGRAVEPVRDPSNLDLRYARVRVRLQLLPELERARPGLSRRLHAAAARAAGMQARVEEAAAALAGDGFEAGRSALREASSPVRAEVFRQLHARLAGARPGLEADHLVTLGRLVTGGRTGDAIDLPGRVRARLGYESLVMSRDQPPASAAQALATRPCSGCGSPSAAHFPSGVHLELGARRPGLRMRPWPFGRTRKLQDILVDAKVPRQLRDALPLVFADGELAWVPGIALDSRWAPGSAGAAVHAELVSSQNPLLESRHQLKESAS